MILGKIQVLKNELAYEIDKKTLAIQLHGTLLTRKFVVKKLLLLLLLFY
jgi:hypothetical protein